MPQAKLISIIIPVYNVENYVADCLNSVAEQSYDNIEVIIVNDGSTDNSLTVCKEFALRYNNVKIINQSNKGLGAARNAGIEHASGEYYVFVDSDDRQHENFCKIMYSAIEVNSVPLAVCHTARIMENGKMMPSDREYVPGIIEILTTDEMLQRVCNNEKNFFDAAAWGKIYHKSLFSAHSNRYPEGVHYEDNWLTMKLCIEAKRLCMVSDELTFYRVRENSITHNILLKKNSLVDFYVQFADTINILLQSPAVSKCTKLSFCDKISKRMGDVFQSYLFSIYQARVLNDLFDCDGKYALFGAGFYGTRFISLILADTPKENVVFIDNNSELHGSEHGGVLVISLGDYLSGYEGYKLIVTNRALFEVIAQLRNAGTLRDINELFPNEGKTAIEKAFCKGIEYFLDTLQKYEVY